MSYIFEYEVVKALEELLKAETNYDVIIHIGVEPNFKEFHLHSNLLSCRSHYFNSILSENDTKKENGKYVIKKPNITPQAFDVVIKYLYTGHIDITNKTGIDILNLMTAFDDLKLNQLVKLAEDFLNEKQQLLFQDDSVEIFQMICHHKIFDNIKELCLERICFEPKNLFNSTKFINLHAPLLEIILKRDDLNLDEIEIWENLVKWGLAQEKLLNEDVSTWNQEKFKIFERILHKFIPLIRFYDISSDDYFNRVKPYEKILSKELHDDILKFHMISEYKPTTYSSRCYNIVDSILINQKHIKIFANWIDKKEKNSKGIIPYEFNLILRGSRDGFDPTSFHSKCDNKGANIVVIKIKNMKRSESRNLRDLIKKKIIPSKPSDPSYQIVGGYNPLDLEGRGYKGTQDSFIFSFSDSRDISSGKVGRIIDNNFNGAVISDSQHGPIFGAYGSDLCMQGTEGSSKWYSHPSSYADINIPRDYFDIDDYEVFQVKKKISAR